MPTMTIQMHKIIATSTVDGPGERTVLFAQGCAIGCKGCQSKHLWNPRGGREERVFDVAQTLAMLSSRHGNVTLSGGEIMMQPEALAELVWRLRQAGVKHIIVYTGYTWEALLSPVHPAYPWMKQILENIDVLVDGPFIKKLDNPFLIWRGSTNQRPINVPESLAAGRVVILDWDNPRLVINPDGSVLLPIGLAPAFAGLGQVRESRMCGQSR